MDFYCNFGLQFRYAWICDKNTASGRFVFKKCIRYVKIIDYIEMRRSMKSAIVMKIQFFFRPAGRHIGIIAVVEPDGDAGVITWNHILADVSQKWQIAAAKCTEMAAVDPQIGNMHCRTGGQKNSSAIALSNVHCRAIPAFALINIVRMRLFDTHTMRQKNLFPGIDHGIRIMRVLKRTRRNRHSLIQIRSFIE